MTSNRNPTGSQRFYDELRVCINQAIQHDYPGTAITLIPFSSQGDFHWYYQNLNEVFNQRTFDFVSARVLPGEVPGTAQISPAGGFPTAYDRVVTAIAFTLSTVDQEILNAAQEKAQVQAQEIIKTYQGIFAKITDADMEKARDALGKFSVANKQDYVISYVMGCEWSGRQQAQEPPLRWSEMQAAHELKKLLPQMPAEGTPVLSAVKTYLKVLESVVLLEDQLSLGGWTRRRLIANTERPSTDNGGMRIVNPTTGRVSENYQVGYGISTSLAGILKDLTNKERIIRCVITTSGPYGSELRAGADCEVGSVLSFCPRGGFDHNINRVEGSSGKSRITIEYQGYTLVSMAPTTWDKDTDVGWYDGNPISDAVRNFKQDVTGFTFVTNPRYNMGSLADGGEFGMLTNLLISNKPTYTVDFEGGNFEQFRRVFREGITGNLTLCGGKSLGGCTARAYCLSYSRRRSPSEFSVIFRPLSQALSQSPLEQTAHVIGGTFNFPSPVRAGLAKP